MFTGTSAPNKNISGSLQFFDPSTFDLVYKIEYPGGVSCNRIQWHPRLNQIIVGLSDGTIKVYYDQTISTRGVMSCVTKPLKRNRASEVVREDMVLSRKSNTDLKLILIVLFQRSLSKCSNHVARKEKKRR